MGAIEAQEKFALQEVAAFSVFWSIILFVIAFILLCWASFFLYSHCKKHRGHSTFQQSGFILQDNKLMMILSYTAMALYTLSLFSYLVCNGTLGVDYDNTKHDTYGNSQIVAIIFWGMGHTLFYAIFMLRLNHFIRKTTYNLSAIFQYLAFGLLTLLWFVTVVVMCVWIDEFHTNYHLGSVNDTKIVACMVIAFASHIWFCLALIFFFSHVLFKVIQTRTVSLIDSTTSSDRLSKSVLEEKVTTYITRMTVLCFAALVFTTFCQLMWIILLGMGTQSVGFLRFCWWLFPVNVLVSFLCVLLAMNFHPDILGVYMKTCVCCHTLCQYYCIRATIPGGSRHQIKNYGDDEDTGTLKGHNALKRDDDDDDDDEDEEDRDNPYSAARQVEDDDDEDSSESEDGNLRGNHTAAYSTAMNS